jgi:PAS domain S-box-containing protein
LLARFGGLDSHMGASTDKEISCRITRTLLLYVMENNNGSLGSLLDGLELDQQYLMDTNNWVSHAFLQVLYHRMIKILGEKNAVYEMTLASERFQSLGLLDRIVRLVGTPKLIYGQAPKYNKLLKLNGDVFIHELGNSWVLLEDRYHNSAQKTRYDCDYARGVLAGIPTMFGMPLAHVEEIECQVRPEVYGERVWPDHPTLGLQGCLYRVHWKGSKSGALWKRFFARRSIYERAIEDLQEANQRIQEQYEEARQMATNLEKVNIALKVSKRKLEASERRYRLLAENASDIIWTLNLRTMRFDYVSPSVLRVRGFTTDEAMEMSLEETLSRPSLELTLKAMAEELEKDGKEGVDPNRSRTLEVQQACKDGSFVWAEATVTFIRNEEGRPVGVWGATRDINERKRAEEERRKLEERLQHAQRMESIGTLAGGIAHDFNNLLAAITGYISLAQLRTHPGDSVFDLLSAAEETGLRAKDLTQRLITFSKGGAPIKRTVSVAELIMDSSGLTLNGSTVRCDFSIPLDLWPVDVDEGQMGQVIGNLIQNAREAMPNGGVITLKAENATLNGQNVGEGTPSENGHYVMISIQDEGCGIAPEDLRRVFDAYFTSKDMGAQKGMGLGLTIAYSIVTKHGGYMEVQSQVRKGSIFSVYLPSSGEAPVKETEVMVRRGRILVMDDEACCRDVLGQMLKHLGYKASFASDGAEAVFLFKEAMTTGRPFDASILNFSIGGGMGGKETIQKLKQIAPDICAVLATGYPSEGIVGDFRKYGFSALLRKPCKVDELQKVLEKVISSRKVQ